MKRLIAAVAIGFVASLSAATAEVVTVESYRGSVEVARLPSSVFVYDMAALEALDALGVDPDSITSVRDTFLDYLQRYEGEAGTLFEPDFEEVHASSPDMVIIGGRSSSHFDAMQKIAPTIDMTIWGNDLIETGLARLEAYGLIFDRVEEASTLRGKIESAIELTADAVEGKGNALIVLTNGPKISAYGRGSRFGWLQEVIDLPFAVSSLETTTHGQVISFEFIREVDPDWLIVVDRVAAIGGEGGDARTTLDNPIVRDTRAWKSGQVIYLDAGPIYLAGGGVHSTRGTLETIRTAFEAVRRVQD